MLVCICARAAGARFEFVRVATAGNSIAVACAAHLPALSRAGRQVGVTSKAAAADTKRATTSAICLPALFAF
jgi:hypothetical protein